MGGLRWTAAGRLLIALLKLRGEPLPPPGAWPSLAVLGILLIGFGNGGGGVGGADGAERPDRGPRRDDAVLDGRRRAAAAGRREAHAPPCRRPGRRLLRHRAAGLAGDSSRRVAAAFSSAFWRRSSRASDGRSALPMPAARARTENVLAARPSRCWRRRVPLVAGAGHGEWANLRFNARTSAALVYLLVVGSIVGFSAYAYALKHLPVATVSLYAYINPVIAVLLGTVVLGEPFSARICRGVRRRARGHRDRQEH